MMQHLANDPNFWLAVTALVGMVVTAAATLLAMLIAWAKAKTAEYEARGARRTADVVAEGQGVQQATLVQHTAQIAALQATNQATGEGRQATVAPVAPAAPGPVMPAVPPGVAAGPTTSHAQMTFEQGIAPEGTPP